MYVNIIYLQCKHTTCIPTLYTQNHKAIVITYKIVNYTLFLNEIQP